MVYTKEIWGILLVISVFMLDSCVSSKKFKSVQAKIDSLTAALQAIQPPTGIPSVSNPPPMPSQSVEINCPAISRCKTFEDVDNIFKDAFTANKKERYYFNFDGGFAVATPFESIDEKGVVQGSQNNRSSQESVFASFFTDARKHLSDLLFGTTDYTRFIIIIVSPKLNKIGGYKLSEKLYEKWFESKFTKVPDTIANEELPSRTTVYALLYEFKKNGIEESSNQLFGAKCISRIDNLNLILSICNYQKPGKN